MMLLVVASRFRYRATSAVFSGWHCARSVVQTMMRQLNLSGIWKGIGFYEGSFWFDGITTILFHNAHMWVFGSFVWSFCLFFSENIWETVVCGIMEIKLNTNEFKAITISNI